MGKLYASGSETYLGISNATHLEYSAIETWISIAMGTDHAVAIRSDGTLWARGLNTHGQLGLGDTSLRSSWTQVGSDTSWSSIACGEKHTLALKTGGTLWATGLNSTGQLGLGDVLPRSSFTQVGSSTLWASIAAGMSHSFGIRSNNTLWSTGYNDTGQLGHGNTNQYNSFSQVGSDTNWASVACGWYYTMAIKTTGAMYGTGVRDEGQLGIVCVEPFITSFTPEETEEPAATNWSKVACAEIHTLAIKTNGALYGSGAGRGQAVFGGLGDQSYFTQIGSFTDWSDIVAEGPATAGFSMGLRSGGLLYATGFNGACNLGTGDDIDVSSFTLIGTYTKWAYIAATKGFDASILIASVVTYGKHKSISGGIRFNNKELIGDVANGKIYELKTDEYQDDGTNIQRIRRGQILSADNNYIVHNKFQLEFEPGVGLDGEDAPVVTLKWSDDGGNNWTDGIDMSIGEYQDYAKRAIWRRLGKARQRIYEISCKEPVKLIIIDAFAEIDVLQG